MIAEQIVPIVSVSLILSVLTFLATPNLGRRLRKMRIVGIDVHKVRRPSIPEMGGIVIFFSILSLLSFVYFLTGAVSVLLIMVSTLLFGIYGLFDDLKQLGKYQKIFLSVGIALLMIIPASSNAYLIVPLIFLTVAVGNIFNIFAGFNGLEVGCTSMIALFFSLLCLMTGNIIPFYLSIGVFIILMGFLYHNKYPATIFPGNVGTFTIGGFFAGICLYFNMYSLLVPLLMLHIADVALKGASAGYFSSNEKVPTKINGDNVLVPGNDYLSLTRLVLKIRPMTERQLVYFFWFLSFLIGMSTVIITASGAFS